MRRVLYPNSLLANPSPVQRKSTLRTESVEMWTFLGKYVSPLTFCFLVLSEGLHFLVLLFGSGLPLFCFSETATSVDRTEYIIQQ